MTKIVRRREAGEYICAEMRFTRDPLLVIADRIISDDGSDLLVLIPFPASTLPVTPTRNAGIYPLGEVRMECTCVHVQMDDIECVYEHEDPYEAHAHALHIRLRGGEVWLSEPGGKNGICTQNKR